MPNVSRSLLSLGLLLWTALFSPDGSYGHCEICFFLTISVWILMYVWGLWGLSTPDVKGVVSRFIFRISTNKVYTFRKTASKFCCERCVRLGDSGSTSSVYNLFYPEHLLLKLRHTDHESKCMSM